MSDYAQVNDYSAKDALATGNPEKLILGSDIDDELAAISTAIATKLDTTDLASQAQAEAEASNVVVMTPLRVANWADYNAGIVGDLQGLADPNADRVLFWDDSAGAAALLAPDGTSIAITGTTLATGSNVPLLNAANSFSAAQSIAAADNADTLQIKGATSGRYIITAYDTGITGTLVRALNTAGSAYIPLKTQALTMNFVTTSTTGLADITLNGVAASDFARLSQSNTFTGANQTITNAANGSGWYLSSGAGVTGSFFYSTSPAIAVGSTSAHALHLYTNSLARLAIDSSGNYDFKSGTVTTNNASASEVGYKGLPLATIAAATYTLGLADAGTTLYLTGAGAACAVTIPAHGSVNFPIGTVVTFISNAVGTATIGITSDTLYLAGTAFGTTGTRTLAGGGIATAIKFISDGSLISGAGLS